MAEYRVFFKPNFIPDGNLYPASVSTVAATIAVTAGSAAVAGTGTHFLTSLTPGQYIAWIGNNGVRRQAKILSIASDVALTLTANAVAGSTLTAGPYQAVYDVTDRLMVSGVPQITVGTQRRENPFLLTYGEISLTFFNADGYFDDLMDQDSIIGTNPAKYRAPLLHYGQIYFARKEFGRAGGFQNIFLGFVDPKSLRFNRDAATCSFTSWGVPKLFERGNAERVNRFSSLYATGLPQPFILSGYDVVHPASPPGVRILTPTLAGNIPLVDCDPTLDKIYGNLTLFTRDLRIGNTITINGVSATVLSIESDGEFTLSSLWGGVDSLGFNAFMYISGQSDSCFLLSRNAAYSGPATEAKDLEFFPGDRFKGISRVLPSEYVEGMDVTDQSDEATISGTAAVGNDLLIFTVDPVPDMSLFAGSSSLQVITPWWHGKRYTKLIQLLVDEVNLALVAASYPTEINAIEDAFSTTTAQPTIDVIDSNGLIFPVTGFGWYKTAAAGIRRLAQASGFKGQTKADFLLDPVAADRTFLSDLFDTAPVIGYGTALTRFKSPTYGYAFTYQNPSSILAGQAPPPDIALVPSVGQDLIAITAQDNPNGPHKKIHVRWALTPGSYTTAAAAVKYAYRIESFDVCAEFTRTFPNPDNNIYLWQNVVGFTLGRYETTGTVPNEVWAVSGGGNAPSTVTETKGPQGTYPGVSSDEPQPPTEPSTQGQVMVFHLTFSDYVYLVTDGGKRIAYWYKSTTGDTVAPATVTAGLAQFVWNAGGRSGGLWDGTNIFYFADSIDSESLGIGTISGSAASGTITGSGTKFIRDLRAGDKLLVYNLQSPLPNLFIVQSDPVSDTSCSVLPVIGAGGIAAENYKIVKATKKPNPSFYYWNGAAMVAGTTLFFPGNLHGADWAHAMIDGARGIIYVVCNQQLYRIKYTYAAGVITASDIFTSVIDTPNYNPDGLPRSGVGPIAWLTGPVDVDMGTVDGAVPYGSASDAILVGTLTQDYIYSDEFAGIIKIADFTGMACSTAIESLIQIPQQVLTSGCDTETTADPSINDPTPTVTLQARIVTGAPSFNATDYAISCQDELWICQYNSIQVQNSQLLQNFQGGLIPVGSNINTGIVINDREFIFDGTTYQVLAARYGGVNALNIDNPFLFSTSVAKMLANAYAFEFLIPRIAAKLKIQDPFLINGSTILLPLTRITYLKTAPTAYTGGVTAAGKITKISYQLEANGLDLEIS